MASFHPCSWEHIEFSRRCRDEFSCTRCLWGRDLWRKGVEAGLGKGRTDLPAVNSQTSLHKLVGSPGANNDLQKVPCWANSQAILAHPTFAIAGHPRKGMKSDKAASCSWGVSANHTSCNWATSLSLKGIWQCISMFTTRFTRWKILIEIFFSPYFKDNIILSFSFHCCWGLYRSVGLFCYCYCFWWSVLSLWLFSRFLSVFPPKFHRSVFFFLFILLGLYSTSLICGFTW